MTHRPSASLTPATPLPTPTGPASASQRPGTRAMTASLDAYTAAMDDPGAPLLGHVVLYSVFEGRVRHTDLERWFIELGLDAALLPPAIRAIDAFEQVTGARGVNHKYALESGQPATGNSQSARRTSGQAVEITLMWRHVRRDRHSIVRHLVREVRDATHSTLTYSQVAECEFVRDTRPGVPRGAGSLRVNPDYSALATLGLREAETVMHLLDEVRTTYQQRCHYYTGDRLRTLVHDYVVHLDAIKVRPTGGVYFVHRAHADILARLRTLVSRLGPKSELSRIPIPDQHEMRSMIETAWANQARDELDRLSHDIVQARRNGASDKAIEALHRRFTALKKSTEQHAQVLSLSLGDTQAALRTVNAQLATLLVSA
ncbi:DUF6744 family protein [Actinomadura kijaniata]|uniref:DUF6744 family protein n=1 Tax=Actinomadura kijaniata TaxID=46161 RepID=UPI00082DFA1B|nr:DUF6744 family protein [Actinomadura kijaniata]